MDAVLCGDEATNGREDLEARAARLFVRAVRRMVRLKLRAVRAPVLAARAVEVRDLRADRLQAALGRLDMAGREDERRRLYGEATSAAMAAMGGL